MADIQPADRIVNGLSEEPKSSIIVSSSSGDSVSNEKSVDFTDVEAHIRFKDFKEKQVIFLFFIYFSPCPQSLTGKSLGVVCWLTFFFFTLLGLPGVDIGMVRNNPAISPLVGWRDG